LEFLVWTSNNQVEFSLKTFLPLTAVCQFIKSAILGQVLQGFMTQTVQLVVLFVVCYLLLEVLTLEEKPGQK
jgi:hypothetical protein